jgi:parallel beta-helix repeat protein
MNRKIACLMCAVVLSSLMFSSMSWGLITKSVAIASSGTIVSVPDYVVSTLTEFINVLSSVLPGDVVQLRGGTYQLASMLTVQRSGSSGNPITYEAYPNEKVIFDGSQAISARQLIQINGNWVVLKSIEVRNAPQGAGIQVFGNDCVLDHVETHHNAGIGANSFGARCQFLHCVAHDNVDPQSGIPGGDADGLGASSPASGCYFLSCVAYSNSDDGIDTYGSSNNTIEKCACYDNGRLQGDGNGIKLVGSTGNKVTKCVAFSNRNNGFAISQSTSGNTVDHCTAYGNLNTNWGYDFDVSAGTGVYTNNIGITYTPPTSNPGSSNNTWNLGITNYGFISTVATSPDFLSLSASSVCRGRATDGSDLGALQYGGRISDLLGT